MGEPQILAPPPPDSPLTRPVPGVSAAGPPSTPPYPSAPAVRRGAPNADVV